MTKTRLKLLVLLAASHLTLTLLAMWTLVRFFHPMSGEDSMAGLVAYVFWAVMSLPLSPICNGLYRSGIIDPSGWLWTFGITLANSIVVAALLTSLWIKRRREAKTQMPTTQNTES
jgi:uncharacterized protein YggT (Ycf19 family)